MLWNLLQADCARARYWAYAVGQAEGELGQQRGHGGGGGHARQRHAHALPAAFQEGHEAPRLRHRVPYLLKGKPLCRRLHMQRRSVLEAETRSRRLTIKMQHLATLRGWAHLVLPWAVEALRVVSTPLARGRYVLDRHVLFCTPRLALLT